MSNTITSVYLPKGKNIYQFLADVEARGYLIYLGKGKLLEIGMFQIANMGEIYEKDCRAFLKVLGDLVGK
jgi:2-aminoethylphosphonate-pyruvate transaminase